MLSGCSESENRFRDTKIDLNTNIKTRILRLDKSVFELSECITPPAKAGNYDLMTVDIPDEDSMCLTYKIQQIRESYGDNKYGLYLAQLGAMRGDVNPATLFYLFLSHPAYNELYRDCEKKYDSVSDLEGQFDKAFSRARELIQGYKIPEICTVVTGFAESVAVDSSTVYVTLEYYLGADYKNYQYVPGIYEYMIPNLKREKFVPDVLYNWTASEYELQKEGANLLDMMVHNGKILYAVEAMLPDTDPKLLMGYDDAQWEWCENNEKSMWNYLREYNQLFSTDSKTMADYLYPANCTKYFSTDEYPVPVKLVVRESSRNKNSDYDFH